MTQSPLSSNPGPASGLQPIGRACLRTCRTLDALRRPVLRRHRWKRGMSLFGVLLGLTLGAVVMVGAVGVYNSARESANRSTSLELLNALRSATETVFAGVASYGDDTDLVPLLDRRGGIPDYARNLEADDVVIRHPFGGEVTITGGPDGNTNEFLISFADVDDEVCAAMGDAYAGRTRARAGIVSITVNDTEIIAPFTLEQISGNCDDGDGANTIGFTFG